MNEPGLSRRDFIKRGTTAAAGMAVFGVGRAQAEPRHGGIERPEDLEQWQHIHNQIIQLVDTTVPGWNEPSDHGYWSPREISRSQSDIDTLRHTALKKIGEDVIRSYIELSRETNRLPEAYRALYELDLHGLVIASLAEQGKYFDYEGESVLFDGKCWDKKRILQAHFMARAADCLPRGDVIQGKEIDTRLFFTDDAEMTEDMLAVPGWSTPKRQVLFQQALDDQPVRALLQHSDCTLAEAYSIIKTALLENGYVVNRALPNTVKRLLKARQIFLDATLLGPKTDDYITVNYATLDSAEYLDKNKATFELADMCSVPKLARHHYNADDPHEAILQAIALTDGNTTLFVNAHGDQKGEIVLEKGSTERLSASAVAAALLDRLHRTQDPGSLQAVNMILTTCSGSDFVFRLRFEFMRQYQERPLYQNGHTIPVQDISLPTIVTMSQLGSAALSDTFFGSFERMHAIIGLKDGPGLSGRMLMRRMQPMDYVYSDMAFFIDTDHQTPYMIG